MPVIARDTSDEAIHPEIKGWFWVPSQTSSDKLPSGSARTGGGLRHAEPEIRMNAYVCCGVRACPEGAGRRVPRNNNKSNLFSCEKHNLTNFDSQNSLKKSKLEKVFWSVPPLAGPGTSCPQDPRLWRGKDKKF